MLEHFFGSRTRVKILNLFIRHPEEVIFVRELTRRIGTQINAVRRELANLIRIGFLLEATVKEPKESKIRGLKRKYYKVNSHFPLLEELRALLTKAQLLLEQKLDQEIVKMGDIRYLAFLGSFLGHPSAPVDIFIIGRVSKKSLQSLIAQTEKEFGFEINFSLMSLEEYLYRKDITDRFLYAILEAPKHVVVDRLTEKA